LGREEQIDESLENVRNGAKDMDRKLNSVFVDNRTQLINVHCNGKGSERDENLKNLF
jgi:hypothetical protein